MNSFELKPFFKVFCIALSAVVALLGTVGAKPTIHFNIPENWQGFPTFTSLTQHIIHSRDASQMKTYSGKRVSNDSLLYVYYHDSTVAVLEIDPNNVLIGCELIEIYNDKEEQKLLQQLSKYSNAARIRLEEMFAAMDKCEKLDEIKPEDNSNPSDKTIFNFPTNTVAANLAANIFPKNPGSLLSGIVPGTKWCGTGDIAESYYDLGAEKNMDRCCRQHDLCPVKIRGLQTKYDLSNSAIYTKSHCYCDDLLYECLKEANTTASKLLGSIYFNLVQVPCLSRNDDDPENGEYAFRKAREGF